MTAFGYGMIPIKLFIVKIQSDQESRIQGLKIQSTQDFFQILIWHKYAPNIYSKIFGTSHIRRFKFENEYFDHSGFFQIFIPGSAPQQAALLNCSCQFPQQYKYIPTR